MKGRGSIGDFARMTHLSVKSLRITTRSAGRPRPGLTPDTGYRCPDCGPTGRPSVLRREHSGPSLSR